MIPGRTNGEEPEDDEQDLDRRRCSRSPGPRGGPAFSWVNAKRDLLLARGGADPRLERVQLSVASAMPDRRAAALSASATALRVSAILLRALSCASSSVGSIGGSVRTHRSAPAQRVTKTRRRTGRLGEGATRDSRMTTSSTVVGSVVLSKRQVQRNRQSMPPASLVGRPPENASAPGRACPRAADPRPGSRPVGA